MFEYLFGLELPNQKILYNALLRHHVTLARNVQPLLSVLAVIEVVMLRYRIALMNLGFVFVFISVARSVISRCGLRIYHNWQVKLCDWQA